MSDREELLQTLSEIIRPTTLALVIADLEHQQDKWPGISVLWEALHSSVGKAQATQFVARARELVAQPVDDPPTEDPT